MNHIYLRSDFADRHEFRLVAIDDAWVRRFREHPYDTTTAVRGHCHSSQRKRTRAPDDTTADVSVVFVLKGEGQLSLHDKSSTRSVRRVEYSNVMMLAERRLNTAGATALQAGPAEPLPLTCVREYNDNVVVAMLSRMFDSHVANPQLNILMLLADSYLSINELEKEDEADGGETETTAAHSNGAASSGYTFAELTRKFNSSPVELAQLLQNIGAVVHHGLVRLLHPSLVYEALGAVLTYFDAADPVEVSWQAVRHHLSPSVYPAVVLRSLEAVYGTSPSTTDAAQKIEDVSVMGMVGLLNIPRVLTGLAAGIFDTHAEVTRRTLSTGAVARGLPLEEFLLKWWDSIPSSLFGTAGIPSLNNVKAAELFLEKLRGCAVVEPRVGAGSTSAGNSSTSIFQGTLWWLPKEILTNDFAARLRVLFELRPQKWDQQDLKAYMEGLLAPDQNFSHIILRYAREYRIPGQAVQYAPLT